MEGGAWGVDMFFTLSGFVITTILLKELTVTGRVRLGAFYANRAGRLWPALFLLCAGVAAIALVFPSKLPAGQETDALRSALHIMNLSRGGWFGPEVDGGATAHTWSLAVEEQFYLVWPLLLIALLRFYSLRVTAVVTVALALCALVQRIVLQSIGASSARIYNGPDTRADELLIGCVLAMIFALIRPGSQQAAQFANNLRLMVWPAALALVVFLIFVPHDGTDNALSDLTQTAGPTIVATVTAILIGGLATNPHHKMARILAHRLLSWPGQHLSYGIYLWHYPVVLVMARVLPNEGLLPLVIRTSAALLITVVLALVSAKLIEAPIRRAVRSRSARRPVNSSLLH